MSSSQVVLSLSVSLAGTRSLHSTTNLQTCSFATLNFACLPLCHIAALQFCNLATLQPCNIAAVQFCNVSILHPCNFATLHDRNIHRKGKQYADIKQTSNKSIKHIQNKSRKCHKINQNKWDQTLSSSKMASPRSAGHFALLKIEFPWILTPI